MMSFIILGFSKPLKELKTFEIETTKRENKEKFSPSLSSYNLSIDYNKTWGGINGDYGWGMGVDSSNNIFIVGHTDSFGSGKRDIILIKYNNLGEKQWNKTWGGGEEEHGMDVAFDSFDNIYIIGYTVSFGEGATDFLLLKYNSAGDLQWYKTWGGNNYDYGRGITIDSLDNIFVTGSTSSFETALKNYDIVLIKYNSLGDIQWNKTWGGNDGDYAEGLEFDGLGNIYITGYTHSYGAGFRDILLLKYDSVGNFQWYKIWGGINDDMGFAIDVDFSDNIYVVGYTESFGLKVRNILIIKYNSSGVEEWSKTWSSDDYNNGYGVIKGLYDKIYVVGHTSASGIPTDVVLVEYNSSGDLQGYERWGGSENENGRGVAMDSKGDIYVVGHTMSFGIGSFDIFILKYSVIPDYDFDTDEDGLSDYNEANIYLTDATNPDSDDDNLMDGEEINIYLTDPNDSDFDDDNIPDGEEINTYLTDPNDSDSDDDNLMDGEEINTYLTDPNDSDSDDDNLTDGEEINTHLTDPNDSDSDDDNLTDYDEVKTHLTDPNNSDSDDDNLTDGEEINTYFTDPNNSDSDDDNIPDGWEVLSSLDPLVNDSGNDPDNDNLSNLEEYQINTDPNDSDSDDDNLTDGEEVNTYSTDPNDSDSDNDKLSDGDEVLTYFTNPNQEDTDNDKISDGDEVNKYYTDPNSQDTDGDGFSDYDEIFTFGTDPNLVFSSLPVNFTLIVIIISALIVFFLLGLFKIKSTRRRRIEKYVINQIKDPDKKILDCNKFKIHLGVLGSQLDIKEIIDDHQISGKYILDGGVFIKEAELDEIKKGIIEVVHNIYSKTLSIEEKSKLTKINIKDLV